MNTPAPVPMKVGDILISPPGTKSPVTPMRILGIEKPRDRLLVIAAPNISLQGALASEVDASDEDEDETESKAEPVPPVKKRARTSYVAKPRAESYRLLEERVGKDLIAIPSPRVATLTDDDMRALARNEKEKAAIERSIKTRDRRMLVVNKIHCEPGSEARRSAQDLLTDPALPELIKKASKDCGVNIVTAYSWLHRFWAGGSTANALLETFVNCGGRGKPKAQKNPLGRKPKIEVVIPPGERRYTLKATCKQKLSWGYLLIRPGVTENDAYLLTMAVHWADHVEDPVTGKVTATLFKKWRRPTFSQFKRWGKAGAGVSATELLLGRREYEQKTEARGGSEHDHVAGFGHWAEFDATSTDLYLVRVTSRLKKLPPMTRMILRETRLGIIYGLYCGWEHPSPATAALCILNGADPDKHLWAKWHFGLEIPEGATPGLLARNITADNGELKAHAATEAERQFGYSISIARAHRGDDKGGEESTHHAQHKQLDHKVPGTTLGRPAKRGEPPPATKALWNYYEYMRELILLIVKHNTDVDVPHLAPDGFLLQDPPVRPTRINILNWMKDNLQDMSLDYAYEDMLAFHLPDHPAVIRRNGVYLSVNVQGTRMLVPRLRYKSDELVSSGLMKQVKTTGKRIETTVKFFEGDLSRAWLPTRAGLIPLRCQGRDSVIVKKLSLTEWLLQVGEAAARKALAQGDQEQRGADALLRQGAITVKAKAELSAEVEALGKAPSQREMKAGLRDNVAEEMEHLRSQVEWPKRGGRPDAPDITEPPREERSNSAAEKAMAEYYEAQRREEADA